MLVILRQTYLVVKLSILRNIAYIALTILQNIAKVTLREIFKGYFAMRANNDNSVCSSTQVDFGCNFKAVLEKRKHTWILHRN